MPGLLPLRPAPWVRVSSTSFACCNLLLLLLLLLLRLSCLALVCEEQEQENFVFVFSSFLVLLVLVLVLRASVPVCATYTLHVRVGADAPSDTVAGRRWTVVHEEQHCTRIGAAAAAAEEGRREWPRRCMVECTGKDSAE